jgi:transcriptional regulator with XRE-family HTH domain
VKPQTALTIQTGMARKPRPDDIKKADLDLGRRLARLRRLRGLTQIELADQLGVVQPIISDFERGKLRPNPQLLAKLAVALHISADELLGIAPRQHNGEVLSRRFLRRLKAVEGLPKRDQEALLRTIDAFLAARKAS